MVSSHDRYFLDRTVETLLAFEEGQLNPRPFSGSYSDYLKAKPAVVKPAAEAPKVSAPVVVAPGAPKVRKLSFKEKRELEELELSIPRSEQRKADLEAILVEQGGSYNAVSQAYQELEELKARLERDLDRWAELAELA
jgi:ATP-binding cassette subfamily F protein uup